MLFWSFWWLHGFHTAAVKDSPGKPSPWLRAVPPPKLPEATRLLQPQRWLFPHFNEEYIRNTFPMC